MIRLRLEKTTQLPCPRQDTPADNCAFRSLFHNLLRCQPDGIEIELEAADFNGWQLSDTEVKSAQALLGLSGFPPLRHPDSRPSSWLGLSSAEQYGLAVIAAGMVADDQFRSLVMRGRVTCDIQVAPMRGIIIKIAWSTTDASIFTPQLEH